MLFTMKHLLAALAVLLVHGAIVLKLGVSLSPDAVTFSRWADALIDNHFDFAAVVRAAGPRNLPAGMYMLFVTLVALAKLVAGAKWAAVLAAVNLLCDALTAAILVRLVLDATRSRAAALLAVVFWLLCFDIVVWVRLPLTDVPFLFVTFAAFAALTRKSIVVAALLATIAVLLRPVGFLWIILMALVWAVASGRVSRRRAVAAVLIAAAVMFAGHTLLVRNPDLWPFETLGRSVRWDARSYQRGEVVLARPETSHRTPSTIIDYAAITADRFVHFFAPFGASFSRAHKLAGTAFYGALYLLALIALVRAAARRRDDRADLVILSAVVVLSVAFWHSLVVIDFDWRYRLPVLPHLIFIAAYGVQRWKARPPGTELNSPLVSSSASSHERDRSAPRAQ